MKKILIILLFVFNTSAYADYEAGIDYIVGFSCANGASTKLYCKISSLGKLFALSITSSYNTKSRSISLEENFG
jgi:hypothetical protein